MARQRTTPIGRLLGAVAVVLGGLAVGVVIVEGTLRLAGISYPDFYTDDRDVGRALSPGAHGWYSLEGRAWVEINADGLRDREHEIVKPADTVRIAVLGDSYAEALQVPPDRAFWSVMQDALEGCPALAGKRVEAINFGVSGYGTAQEYQMLTSRVWKYAPDVVVLAVLTGNDVSDNSRALSGRNRAAYYVHDAQGNLIIDPQFTEVQAKLRTGPLIEAWNAVFNNSRLLQLLTQARRQIKLMLDGNTTGETGTGGATGGEGGLDDAVYRAPADPIWQAAWSVTEDLMRAIDANVRAHGARLLLVTLSNGIQVHPDPDARRAYAQRLGVADLLYPDRRLAALAAADGIPFLMLVPTLAARAEADRACLHGFANATPCTGHWNETGHAVTGAAIAETLCRDVLAPATPRQPQSQPAG